MPQKPRLHKVSGKSVIKKCPSTLQNTANENSNELNNAELNQQFETELCWCIQQLQIGLKSQKLNTKQVEDYTKALNTLMNNSAPIIKKRQVMRLSFGDYRAKMAAESQRLNKASCKVKVAPGTPSKKSVFIKKSIFTSTGNTFKFNFEMNDDPLTTDFERCKPKEEDSKQPFHFNPCGNNFRFNFECSPTTSECAS